MTPRLIRAVTRERRQLMLDFRLFWGGEMARYIARASVLILFAFALDLHIAQAQERRPTTWRDDAAWCWGNTENPSPPCALAWAASAPLCQTPGAGGRHCVMNFATGYARAGTEYCPAAHATVVSCQCDPHNAAGRARLAAANTEEVCKYLLHDEQQRQPTRPPTQKK